MLHGVRGGGKDAMTVQLKPPSPFPFHRPDEWQRWRRRFEQFRVASGLSAESQQRQVSTLLYTMGEEAEDTLMSTKISDDEKKDYAKVVAKLDSFFQVRKKVVYNHWTGLVDWFKNHFYAC